MANITIPGVSDTYGTEKIIADLMKVERIPRDRAAEELKKLQSQQAAWQNISQRLTKLRDSARNLFSYRNPFSDRVVKSSNDASITATANRDTLIETRSVTVKQVAEADRFLSSNLPKDYVVPAGTYTFQVGDKTISFDYSGGTLKDFADMITKKGGGLLKASIVSVTQDTQSIAIESLQTGLKNRLVFKDAAVAFGLNAGIIEKSNDSLRLFTLAENTLSQTGTAGSSSVKDGVLRLGTGGAASLSVNPPVSASGKMRLSFELNVINRGDSNSSSQTPPSGPSIPSPGGINYKGVQLENDPYMVDLPGYEAPATPPSVTDFGIVYLDFGGPEPVKVQGIQDANGFVTFDIDLSQYGGSLKSIRFVNNNTGRDVEIKNVKAYDPEAIGEYKPSRPISTAKDAIIMADGIQMTRETNTITDVIPGVTLTVKQASDKPISLSIEPNKQGVKDAIIEFVGNYNRLLADINILLTKGETVTSVDAKNDTSSTSNNAVITELTWMSSDEQTQAAKNLGLLTGDVTLMQLKSSFQKMVMNPYPTSAGNKINLLSQIGISTNSTKGGSSASDASKLRGYLEIDETMLDQAIDSNLPAIKELFGSDSNGDLIVDSGVGFLIDATIKSYVDIGGIIPNKISSLGMSVKDKQKAIDNLDKQLADKEAELRRKYSQMEGSLNQLDSTSNAIDNFNKQNQ